MQVSNRKQRELASRHALFLDIARSVIEEEGFNQLSMERVAELAEYSKGTMYQHFTCKEEMLIQLCVSEMTQKLALFQRATNFDGTHRDHMTAICHANELWGCVKPHNVSMMQNLMTDGIREKATEMSLQRHDELMQRLIGTVGNVVESAMEKGDLPDTGIKPVEMVYGLWSLCYGGQMLQASDIPLEKLGVSNPSNTILRTLEATLDGLQWQPFFNPDTHDTLQVRFRTEIFADEHRQLETATTQKDSQHD